MVQPVERADARANRSRILATAVAVFAERGVDAEMREIAERAGLAVGTVYNHFPSKDELIVAALREAFTEFEGAVTDAEAVPEVVPALRALIVAGLGIVERHGSLFAAILEGRLPAVRAAVEDDDRRAALQARFQALVARGVADGCFRPEIDVPIAVQMLESVMLPWTLPELRLTRDHEQIADATLAIFLNGVRQSETSSKLKVQGDAVSLEP